MMSKVDPRAERVKRIEHKVKTKITNVEALAERVKSIEQKIKVNVTLIAVYMIQSSIHCPHT